MKLCLTVKVMALLIRKKLPVFQPECRLISRKGFSHNTITGCVFKRNGGGPDYYGIAISATGWMTW